MNTPSPNVTLEDVFVRLLAALVDFPDETLINLADRINNNVLPALNAAQEMIIDGDLSEIRSLLVVAIEELNSAAEYFGFAVVQTHGYIVERGGSIDLSSKKSVSDSIKKSSGRSIKLITEAKKQGHKINPAKVIHIGLNRGGKIIWLEEGSAAAGLQHILTSQKIVSFQRFGVQEKEIGDFIFRAALADVKLGIIGEDRIVYKIEYKGQEKRVAISIGDNGYIVGANPVANDKKLKPLEG